MCLIVLVQHLAVACGRASQAPTTSSCCYLEVPHVHGYIRCNHASEAFQGLNSPIIRLPGCSLNVVPCTFDQGQPFDFRSSLCSYDMSSAAVW